MIALALLAAAAAARATSVAGLYQTHQIEAGAGLELREDGHFRYQLDYGAVSESAEGEWSVDGKAVRLTTLPPPKEPAFELLRDDPAPAGELSLLLDDAAAVDSGPLHAIVTLAGEKDPALVVADEQGRIDLRGARVTTIRPLMPITDTVGEEVVLSPERGHRLVYRFHPNDFATAAFRGEPLVRDGSDLVLTRYQTRIRFVRVRP